MLHQVPWSYPAPPCATEHEEIQLASWLRLSPEETTRLRVACRSHNRTVTQVATAITAIANVESALRIAAQHGGEYFGEVLAAFENSTHFTPRFNATDTASVIPISERYMSLTVSTENIHARDVSGLRRGLFHAFASCRHGTSDPFLRTFQAHHLGQSYQSLSRT